MKEIFKLEKKENKLVCPGISEKLGEILSNFYTNKGAEYEKLSNFLKRKRKKGNTGLYLPDIFSNEELLELESLGIVTTGRAPYITVFFYGPEDYVIDFNFSLRLYEKGSRGIRIEESYEAHTKLTKEEVLTGNFDIPETIVVHGMGSVPYKNWGIVPIIRQEIDIDGNLFPKNHWDICINVDSDRLSCLNIFDILEIKSSLKNDVRFMEDVKLLDSKSLQQLTEELSSIFDTLTVRNRFPLIESHAMNFLRFGYKKEIPELSNIDNCILLALTISDFLFKGRPIHEMLPVRLEECEPGHGQSKRAYLIYCSYMTTLSELLGKSEAELIDCFSNDNLLGLDLIPKDKFSEFFNLLRSNLKINFQKIREEEQQEIEEENRRKERKAKRIEKIKQIKESLVQKLENSDVLEELEKLEKFGEFSFWEFRELRGESRHCFGKKLNREEIISFLASELILGYAHKEVLIGFGCPTCRPRGCKNGKDHEQ